MTVLILNNKKIKELKNFNISCKECNSNNIEIEVNWGAYPSSSWNSASLICKDCHNEEEIYNDIN